jgi:hypothetical protein
MMIITSSGETLRDVVVAAIVVVVVPPTGVT